jgi:hypothetical protein
MIFYKLHQGIGIFLMFFIAFIVGPYSYLFHIKMRATLSWLSYACITKKNTSRSEAESKISEIAWSLRFLAFIEFMIANRNQPDRANQGMGEYIKQMIIGLVITVIDVAENYLLPTMVIEQVSVKDAVPKLTEMKSNIPATLAGAFGFDLIGDAISSFSILIYLGVFVGGLGISFLLGSIVPVSLRAVIAGHNFFLAPAILSLFICSFISSFIKISATSLKAIYFSIFYTSINKPLEIDETYRDSVTNYLKFNNDTTFTDTIKEEVRKIIPGVASRTSGIAPVLPTPQNPPAKTYNVKPELIANAKSHIIKMKTQGSSDQQILEFFISKGWPQDLINELLVPKDKAS